MKIRKANIHEADYLSGLSFRSKAYWGYSDEFMEACRGALTISSEDIASSQVFVLEDGEKIKGFFGLELDHDRCLLEYLFIEPESIGSRMGI